MLEPLVQVALAGAAIFAAMAALWLVQRRTKNAGVVDIAWAACIGAAGVFFAATSPGLLERRWLGGAMIAVWSARLSFYLFKRVVGHPEEGRYATLRRQWGDAVNRRMFWFYQLQAIAALLFALPVLVAAHASADSLGAWDGVAVGVWCMGVGFTALADRQLALFRRRPDSRGRTCREGLWRYSRHPNYFFEWLHWWSYVALAASSPWWWATLAVPALLLYVLLFVTGIPPTEAQAVASRGEDYRNYQRTTSAFLPWWPKKA